MKLSFAKRFVLGFFLAAIVAVLCGVRLKEAWAKDTSRWLPVRRFVGDFECGNFAAWSSKEAARPDSVGIVSRPCRSGRYAARFTVRPGERVSNGNRAEITYDNGESPGREGWYAWSFLVPIEYSNVEARPHQWQCLGQWHDQPNPHRGETWDKFPGHSPSIAVYYTFVKGVARIELWYGTYRANENQKIIASVPIQLGKWYDIAFHIGWSNRENGFIEAWFNGKPLTPLNGRDHKVAGANMWNDYSHYLKIGLYRSSDFRSTNSVYFDEVRIGNSLEEVALSSKRRLK